MPEHWRREFASVSSSKVREDLLRVGLFGVHWGEMGSVIKVVMVIMTSDGDPTGVTCRLGTGEIIFRSGLSSTRIVGTTNPNPQNNLSQTLSLKLNNGGNKTKKCLLVWMPMKTLTTPSQKSCAYSQTWILLTCTIINTLQQTKNW